MILVALALMAAPRWLLADEPSTWKAVGLSLGICFVGGLLLGGAEYYAARRLAATLKNGTLSWNGFSSFTALVAVFYLLIFAVLYWGSNWVAVIASTVGATVGSILSNWLIQRYVWRLWRSVNL